MANMREMTCSVGSWALKRPFRITGYTFETVSLLHVTVSDGDHTGQGEGSGIYYRQETGASMLAQANSVRAAVIRGATREDLLRMLPIGGARNAVDCALWDLEAKQSGRRVWTSLDMDVSPVGTVNTVSIGTPAGMAAIASGLDTHWIKVKLDAEAPLERIRAVCKARPDAEIVVDVNEGWNFPQLVELAPRLRDLGVAMIEQPLPRDRDSELVSYRSPLPLCADESCLDTSDFEQAVARYQMINIKLDKTGGLTEALRLAARARAQGVEMMVGNMVGTSLGMAPGFIVAQLCRFVDLDGAVLLAQDRDPPLLYKSGIIQPPSAALWG